MKTPPDGSQAAFKVEFKYALKCDFGQPQYSPIMRSWSSSSTLTRAWLKSLVMIARDEMHAQRGHEHMAPALHQHLGHDRLADHRRRDGRGHGPVFTDIRIAATACTSAAASNKHQRDTGKNKA